MPNPYDPRRLIGGAAGAARVGLDVYSWAEEQVVNAIRQGIDSLDPADESEEVSAEAAPPPAEPDPGSLHGKMTRLLERALDQNT